MGIKLFTKVIFFVMLLSLCCGLASATEYFVSPDGTGNGLSIDTPGDPSAIAPLLVAGDKMYCRGGTYTNEIIDLVSSGTSGLIGGGNQCDTQEQGRT